MEWLTTGDEHKPPEPVVKDTKENEDYGDDKIHTEHEAADIQTEEEQDGSGHFEVDAKNGHDDDMEKEAENEDEVEEEEDDEIRHFEEAKGNEQLIEKETVDEVEQGEEDDDDDEVEEEEEEQEDDEEEEEEGDEEEEEEEEDEEEEEADQEKEDEELRNQDEDVEEEEEEEEGDVRRPEMDEKVQHQRGQFEGGTKIPAAELEVEDPQQTQRADADVNEDTHQGTWTETETKEDENEMETEDERYIFQLSEREKTNKLFNLQFNVASNKYIRVSDGDWEIEGWDTAVYESKNMFRKEEHDWQMVYLSRQERKSLGSIEWRFDFSNDTGLVADHVRIKAMSTTFHTGKISWTLKCAFPGSSGLDINVPFPTEAGEHAMDIPNLKGSNAFTLHADLSGGIGDVDWQHAQLFRTGLRDYSGQQLEITVHFTDEMYKVEKVLRGKYFNGKLRYLVKWRGYPHSANTWEPEAHLNVTLRRHLHINPVRITGKPKKKK
ncbi:uncharacterized protein [Amphiura filiformis]|uniref:uncharacterized protein n=1 Tax=Amphiura filiformis TaxID=82378 RepID=UPI003B218C8B